MSQSGLVRTRRSQPGIITGIHFSNHHIVLYHNQSPLDHSDHSVSIMIHELCQQDLDVPLKVEPPQLLNY